MGSQPLGVAVNNTGTRIYTTSFDGVSVVDGTSHSVIATIPVTKGPSGIAVNPAGTRVKVWQLPRRAVSVIDASSNTIVPTAGGHGAGRRHGQLPGTRAYVANQGKGSVSVIDTATNKEIRKIQVAAEPVLAAINAAGRRLYVTHYPSNNPSDPLVVGFSVIDTESNTKITGIPLGFNAGEGVAVNPAGTRVYVT